MVASTDIKVVKQDSVSASVSVTRNLGNYESLKVEARMETAVAPHETPQEAFDRAWAVAEAEVTEKVTEALGE